MPQKFEHAVRCVGGASFVQWATFYKFEGGLLRFFEGSRIVSVAIHVAGEALVTTEGEHGFVAGEEIWLDGVVNSSPSVNKSYICGTVVSPTSFKIPEVVVQPGYWGACGVHMPTTVQDSVVSAVSVGRFSDQRVRESDAY